MQEVKRPWIVIATPVESEHLPAFPRIRERCRREAQRRETWRNDLGRARLQAPTNDQATDAMLDPACSQAVGRELPR